MTKKVCLVIGAGAGIGGSVGMKFAREGYHAALCRRSDTEGLDKLVSDIEAQGGSASGHLVNAVQEGAIEQLVEEAEQIGACGGCAVQSGCPDWQSLAGSNRPEDL